MPSKAKSYLENLIAHKYREGTVQSTPPGERKEREIVYGEADRRVRGRVWVCEPGCRVSSLGKTGGGGRGEDSSPSPFPSVGPPWTMHVTCMSTLPRPFPFVYTLGQSDLAGGGKTFPGGENPLGLPSGGQFCNWFPRGIAPYCPWPDLCLFYIQLVMALRLGGRSGVERGDERLLV